MWQIFEEFQTGLQDMHNEEWILFRSKIYKFEEYLTTWSNKLNAQEYLYENNNFHYPIQFHN